MAAPGDRVENRTGASGGTSVNANGSVATHAAGKVAQQGKCAATGGVSWYASANVWRSKSFTGQRL